MRANHHKLLAGGIIAVAMFTVACPGPDDSVLPMGAPPGLVERLLVILEADSIPPAALVDSILDTAPTHPAADTASRSHVQCHQVRNIRTRLTVEPPDLSAVSDTNGPSGELCAVVDGYNRGKNQVHGAWIATARIDSVVVPEALTDVPHLGMTPGVNHILAARRGKQYVAVVFPPDGVPLLIPLALERPFNQGRNGIDIAVWRGNVMSGCISCWRRGWCTVGG